MAAKHFSQSSELTAEDLRSRPNEAIQNLIGVVQISYLNRRFNLAIYEKKTLWHTKRPKKQALQ
jgi:hypothetical protein